MSIERHSVSSQHQYRGTRCNARIFVPICAIGCLLAAGPLISVVPPHSPEGGAVRPLAQGTLELVLCEGAGRFRGSLLKDDVLVPRRKIWLSKNHQIELQITSLDYVYSVVQPALGLNSVVLPGLPAFVDLKRKPPGGYEVASDPICGTPWNHSDPPSTVVILP
jgi:hypothetical protein